MTAQNIIPFAFEDNLVRVYKPNGEPWFVGRDVCRVLDIKNESHALARLDDDEKQDGVCITDPMGREQSVICISEPGVFRMIFTSRKPEAERFKRFLAHEVLPALRKHGTFSLPGRDGVASNDPIVEFPTADEALNLHLAKLATLKECRMIHGPRAAARLWRRLGMPQVTESAIEEVDEGRRCLGLLLAAEIEWNGNLFATIHDILDDALDGGELYQMALKRHGVAAAIGGEEGMLVSNNHAWLNETFKGTPFSGGRWRAALSRLPGATLSHRASFGAGGQRRCVFVPLRVLDSFVQPAPQGGNVVPLKS